MILNGYIWNLYKESKDGQKMIADFSMDLEDFCQELESDTIAISIAQTVYDVYSQYSVNNIEEAIHKYSEMVTNGILTKTNLLLGTSEWELYEDIGLVSWGLYFACPEFFLPYLFNNPLEGDVIAMTFQTLEEICTRFNIAIPSLPSKRDKLGKVLYYGQLMRALYEFRQLHNLSPTEMCAFLYDFGLNVIEAKEIEELPKASKVWLIKGGKGDFEFVDQATDSSIAHRWGGNLEIRKGDILLMYLLSPRSYIHSIWRALSDGFSDPFFHYHYGVMIGSMVKTKPVTIQEIKSDPILKEKGLVKANLQGASGDPFSVEEYNAILNIIEKKGQDISSFIRLEPLSYPKSVEINNERDVEIFLVEPLLERLGFIEDNWIRQMPIRMGRGERNYPDYAFGATTKRGEESARMVLEAKYRISTQKELMETFYQAKSYALRLQAKLIVLCAIDGIWIFEYKGNNFNLEDCIQKSWNELSHPDILHQVLLVIGKKAVLESR